MGIGSFITNGVNAVGDYYAQDREQDAINRKIKAAQEARAVGDKYYGEAQGMYQPGADNYLSDVSKWRDVASQKLPEYQQFDKSGYDVNAYLDPSMAYQQEQAARAVQQSAAAQGGLYSGATGKALQDRATKLAQQDYGNAFDRMTSDRAFGYQDWTKKFDTDRAGAVDHRSSLSDIVTRSQGERDNLLESKGGQANLAMGNITDIGDLQASKDISRGNYLRGQFNRAGKSAGEGADMVQQTYFPTKPKIAGG